MARDIAAAPWAGIVRHNQFGFLNSLDGVGEAIGGGARSDVVTPAGALFRVAPHPDHGPTSHTATGVEAFAVLDQRRLRNQPAAADFHRPQFTAGDDSEGL
jgi:hypothetical protein